MGAPAAPGKAGTVHPVMDRAGKALLNPPLFNEAFSCV